MKKILVFLCSIVLLGSCNDMRDPSVPLIGFLDFIEDPTIELAKKGFFDGLAEEGFSEELGTLKVQYRNAQGDIPALGQSCDYLISKTPDLIASNVTLSTITVAQKTHSIPIFMMVSPRPDLAGLTDEKGKAPGNLFGTFETLEYIDTSAMLISTVMPHVKIVATLYNQSEPQSVAAFERMKVQLQKMNIKVISLPVNNSSETQLVTQTLLAQKPDAFFALPDNVIFASFETIAEQCNDAGVAIFTSESGLVSRGALCSFGADFYNWGLQSGRQAAIYLKKGSTIGLKPELVKVRHRVYNPTVAEKLKISFGPDFLPVSQ